MIIIIIMIVITIIITQAGADLTGAVFELADLAASLAGRTDAWMDTYIYIYIYTK